jgi:CheY-like chemotaxis protein
LPRGEENQRLGHGIGMGPDEELVMRAGEGHPVVQRLLRRIVVAEDDREFRTLLCGALRDAGYDVIELRDGIELLDFVSTNLGSEGQLANIDLIVSDIRMPGYTGMDVLVGLRQALGGTPVILITAFGDDATHELALSMGAVAVLDKPFDVEDLTSAVSDALAEAS